MSMLATYVHAWRTSADALIALAPHLTEDDWATPTDCPGWTVQDVYAHLAHLETDLCTAGDAHAVTAESQQMPAEYTELGVEARRGWQAADVVAEFALRVNEWGAKLDPLPENPAAPAPMTSSGMAWSWDTLLRNRCIDMWTHEQDIRRAVHQPGGLDAPGAMVTLTALSFTLPYILGKKVGPPTGTRVRWNVTGEVPFDQTLEVGDDGRARPAELSGEPTVTLTMSSETFGILTAGRRAPDAVDVEVAGDTALGRDVLAAMAVTP